MTLRWIENVPVGLGQDPNLTEHPELAFEYTKKWGAPKIINAAKFNGWFWFWALAPMNEWIPKVGAASSLRDAQALEVWNSYAFTILYGDYVRNPPYVFQSASALPVPSQPSPVPQPTPTPAPQPSPTSPTAPAKTSPSSSGDFWKPTLIVGGLIAGIVAVAWWAT